MGLYKLRGAPLATEEGPVVIKPVVESDIDRGIKRLKEYLRNEKTTRGGNLRSMSEGTINTRVDMVKSIVTKMGGIEYTPGWLSDAKARLEKDVARNSVIWYLYALEDYLAANGHPLKIAKPIVIDPKPAVWHTDAQARKIIKTGNGPRDRAIMTVLYYGALRNKEVRFLHMNDVDLEHRKIVVQDRGGSLKTYHGRTIPLSEKALPALEEWVDIRRGFADQVAAPWLFVNLHGGQFTKSGITEIVEAAGRRAGIPTHPHALRHTRASFLANHREHPVPIAQLQYLLGHRMITTTQKYLHSSYEDVAESVLQADA